MQRTYNIIKGDLIVFKESVFGGNYRNPVYEGERTIKAKVLKESYGKKRGQHTFTLKVIDVSGTRANEILGRETIRRKGRNLYKECYLIKRIEDEDKETEAKNKRKKVVLNKKYKLWLEEGKIEKIPEWWLKKHKEEL